MTDRVNGRVAQGSFLTGAPNWFSIATIVDVAQTNVTTPMTDLPGWQTYATLGVWTNVTVVDGNGVAQTYSSDEDYAYAFYQQASLNKIISAVSARVNVTQWSVKKLPNSINGHNLVPSSSSFFGEAGYSSPSYNQNFGSAYNSNNDRVNVIDIATEKSLAWASEGYSNYNLGNNSSTNVANETNDFGYRLDVALNGLQVYDWDEILNSYTVNGVARNDPFWKQNGGSVYDYIVWANINTTDSTNRNTLISQSLYLPASDLA
jgi:hypothetical protein